MASERFDEKDATYARNWKEQSSDRGIWRRSIIEAKARRAVVPMKGGKIYFNRNILMTPLKGIISIKHISPSLLCVNELNRKLIFLSCTRRK